jgi:hypothetical protein
MVVVVVPPNLGRRPPSLAVLASRDSIRQVVGRHPSICFSIGRPAKFSEIASFLLAKDLTNRLLD